LVPNPDKVEMNNVVLGSKAEELIVVTAKNAPILIREWGLAETQQDGFSIETTCVPMKSIAVNESCNFKVLWNPVELRRISNVLNIKWRVDSPDVYHEETTSISLSAQSTDSKDCVICETAASEAEKKARKAMLLNGLLSDIDEDGYVTFGENKYRVTENGVILDDKGVVVGVVEPERIPLDLNHKIIGTISHTQDVINENGEKIALCDFDAWNYYGPNLDQDTTIVEVVNNPNFKVGHGYIIKMLLQGDIEVKDDKVIDHVGVLK
jgi:hypothetical protein